MITLPPARTKNKRQHEIFLIREAPTVLEAQARDPERDLVFGCAAASRGWSKSKAELDDGSCTRLYVAPFPARALHSLARDAWHSAACDRGVARPCRVRVAGVYNRSDYADAKYAALVKWANMSMRWCPESVRQRRRNSAGAANIKRPAGARVTPEARPYPSHGLHPWPRLDASLHQLTKSVRRAQRGRLNELN